MIQSDRRDGILGAVADVRPNPLYDPRDDHAACGLGFVVRVSGEADHSIVQMGLEVLRKMEHRGATGADPETGDGAGLLLQLPDGFLRRWAREEADTELPPPGEYAVAMCFLPRDPAQQLICEELLVRITHEEGQVPIGWRDVPVDSAHVGALARESEPVIRQLFVTRGRGVGADAFRRKLYVIRRRVELASAARHVGESTFSLASFSNTTLTYKGLHRASQVGRYYRDLQDPRVESAIALVHSRFSTNTLGTWDLAQPFHYLAHNGEINTVRGNRSWMHAREPTLRSALLGDDLAKLFPIIDERWSDSAALDAALELLVMAGRTPAHALTMLIPAAWPNHAEMPDDIRAFYEFHAALLEPWDGPAAIAFTDGRQVGASLDRNGLRPARYTLTRNGLLVLASEAGVLDLDPADVLVNHRLEPGRMLLVDTVAGRIIGDDELKSALAGRRPYRALLDAQKVYLEDLPDLESPAPEPPELERLQRLFGYTREDLRLVITPMASDGQEAIGSMGVDTPLAALSARPQLLPAYFKQHFAQVTNPAIDPQRETLVMSLRTSVGSQGNLLDESPEHARRVTMTQPVLLPRDLEKLRSLPSDRFRVGTLECLFDASAGARGLERALDALCKQASRLVRTQHTILVLSDRGADETRCPIPILLATAAVHSHLVREGSRTRCGLVVESGEPREVMHFALLIGYGAAAISPYLAFDSIAALHAAGELGELTVDEAQERFVKAIGKGLLKVLSKMGISTIQSYRGAQIFEAVGLGPAIVARYFTGTASRVGGVGLDRIAADAAARQRAALEGDGLAAGGLYQFRVEGEHHVWNPDAISKLQRAVRDESYPTFRAFSEAIDEASAQATTLRSLLELVPAGPPIPLSEVEPSSEIVRRFATGAMSLGSISSEAHETLAIAMNRMGARSNTGEGGEDPVRSTPDANGDLRRSAIKQVASARFGVTTGYLTDADQLQIKVSQGAKPGEGGQLPGFKVNDEIARLRHSTPGVGLISPPPHHDIYSIEDLAQLIYDLRTVNPSASISVKLVAEAGVGTVAAGVAKAKADHIVIAGHDGGTGASPASSLKHAGLPWELGIAETQQVLVANDLRGRVRLQVDGALRTGRDVLVAALLGAEEFAFSTAPLIAAGCIMMRVCHLNTCPVGIATQDPELRRRFAGTPEQIVTYFLYVAEELREILASLGLRSLDEAIGRTDLLRQRGGLPLDLSALIAPAQGREGAATRALEAGPYATDARLDRSLLGRVARAIDDGEPVELTAAVGNTDRAVGTFLSGEIARRAGRDGLPQGTVVLRLRGSAGQSFGAFAVSGLELHLEGQTNDYVGKGLSGALLAVRPYAEAGYDPATSVIIGNTAMYGATLGEAYFAGRAGERFCVRNSGATAVVEGVGDHGCEYMTGGIVAVLGPIGRNFAAGMSGGLAYVYDPEGLAPRRVNTDLVALEPLTDDRELRELIERHLALTGSTVAERLLENWSDSLASFLLVMPNDMRRILAELDPELALQETRG